MQGLTGLWRPKPPGEKARGRARYLYEAGAKPWDGANVRLAERSRCKMHGRRKKIAKQKSLIYLLNND
jgi:hypothetical protein